MLIGWELNFEDIEKKFTVRVKEEYKLVEKYDPDTGKKLPKKVKIITQEGGLHLMYKGKVFSYIDLLIESMLRCDAIDHIFNASTFVVGISIENGISYKKVIQLESKVEEIRFKLIELGLPISKKSPAKVF